MSNVNTVISDFTAGSSLTVRRTVTRIPNGSFIQTAVLTVKATENGSENGGVIAKTIRTFDQSGVGQVENQGGTGTCQLRFELTQTDTRQLPPDQPYYYWIDVFLDADSGESTTVENGLIIATVAPTLRQKDDTVPHQEQQHKDHQQQ